MKPSELTSRRKSKRCYTATPGTFSRAEVIGMLSLCKRRLPLSKARPAKSSGRFYFRPYSRRYQGPGLRQRGRKEGALTGKPMPRIASGRGSDKRACRETLAFRPRYGRPITCITGYAQGLHESSARAKDGIGFPSWLALCLK